MLPADKFLVIFHGQIFGGTEIFCKMIFAKRGGTMFAVCVCLFITFLLTTGRGLVPFGGDQWWGGPTLLWVWVLVCTRFVKPWFCKTAKT